MPPPDNGNEKIPFAELVNVEKIEANTYRSKALAFAPAGSNRTYGGHVYMQACYAAAQTVGKDFVLHNVTGWFLLAGKANERFIYRVRTIRDGGISTRGVDVMQESDPGVCFTCICSFKRPEKTSIPQVSVKHQMNLQDSFGVALKNRRPEEHPEMPGIDAPWYWDYSKQNNGYTDPFPGLQLRKPDMEPYNKDKHGLDRRSLKYYSVLGKMPSINDDPNMHIAAHLYASDRNSLFVISNHLDIGNDYSHIASLSHTVIFHADVPELDMMDGATGESRWFCQEAWTGGAQHGRGLHESRMWREDGLHIASTIQDGMVRLKRDDGVEKAGFSPNYMAKQLQASGGKGKL